MPDRFHMNADLMGTSGLSFQGDQGKTVLIGKSFIMRDGSFTVKHIDLPFYRGTFFPPDRSVDRPLILCETFHNGKIFPAYAPD